MRVKATKWLGVALASTLILSGCSAQGGSPDNSTGPEGAPTSGGELRMVQEEEPVGFSPTAVTDNPSIWTLQLVLDTLVRTSQDGSDVEPSLATEWKQSEDGLAWTFNLREGVTFSDGSPFTSADVKFSLDRATDPELPYGSLNASIESIETPDDFTVVITTSQVWAPLTAVLALFANSIVPKDFGGMSESEFSENPIGTGPFMLETWKKGQTLKLIKNPNYWEEGLPYLDSVVFNIVADSNTRALQLSGGQADINQFPPYSTLEGLRSTPGVTVGQFPSSRLDYLAFNNQEGPLADQNVRLAISHAIDREAIVNAVTYGNSTPAGSYLPPAVWGHDETLEAPKFSLEAAKESLAESDYPDGFETTIMVLAGNADGAAIAQIVQQSLSQINIKVGINTLDPSAFSTARSNHNYAMSVYYVTTDIMDPDQLTTFMTNDRVKANWKDPHLIDLATRAAQTVDRGERETLYHEIQQAISDQAIIAPLFYSDSIFAISDKVHGFETSLTGSYSIPRVWISK